MRGQDLGYAIGADPEVRDRRRSAVKRAGVEVCGLKDGGLCAFGWRDRCPEHLGRSGFDRGQ